MFPLFLLLARCSFSFFQTSAEMPYGAESDVTLPYLKLKGVLINVY